jgi:16S rRNA (guanine527-N7)-methyltransferase
MNETLHPFLETAKSCYELKELERLGLTPDLDQRDFILTYMCLILKWNDVAGLVSKNDESNVFIRHFCDSLQPLLLFGFKKNASILDIGAGGGFPSIPIKIFRPDLTFNLSESNRKKASFLKEVAKELNFKNFNVHNGKVENLYTSEDRYDYIISRGFGSLQKFAQIAKPLLKSDGHMYTFKTKQFTNELDFITNNKDKDGVKISEIAEYDLGNQISGLNLVSLELVRE